MESKLEHLKVRKGHVGCLQNVMLGDVAHPIDCKIHEHPQKADSFRKTLHSRKIFLSYFGHISRLNVESLERLLFTKNDRQKSSVL